MNISSLEHLTPGELYREYYSVSDIKKIHPNLSELDIMNMIKQEVPLRAKRSLESVDLTRFADELPIVKRMVTELYLLRRMLGIIDSRSIDLATKTEYEKLDNAIKKVALDLSEWVMPEEVEIIEETGSYLGVDDIFKLENATPKKMIDHAQTIAEKLRWRPEPKDIQLLPNDVADEEQHIKDCIKLKYDPYTTTANELNIANEKDKLRELLFSKSITREEYIKRRKELN